LANPVLQEGQRAPAFTLPSTQGERLRLTELRGQWVVLFFYRQDGASVCTRQVCEFRDAWPEFEAESAVVLGIAQGEVGEHAAFARRCRLPFPLLADRNHRVASRYGVPRERRNGGRPYLGLVRCTFPPPPTGRIVRIFDDIRVAEHAGKVLRALRRARRVESREVR